MLEGFAAALGLGRRNTDENDDNVLLAPGKNINQQQRPGDRGDGNNDTKWMLVTDGTTRGAARVVSQTQEGDQQLTDQRRPPPTKQISAQPPTPQENFSGIATTLKKQGHKNYKIPVMAAELALQRDIPGNTTKQAAFREFTTNYTQLRVYLAMVGEQKNVTMIHMLGAFYLVSTATNAYQGKVLGFVGDRRATKEPTPVCLPQVKAWQWYSGQVNTDKDNFVAFFEDEDNKNK